MGSAIEEPDKVFDGRRGSLLDVSKVISAETKECDTIDASPYFISCSALDKKTGKLICVTSMEQHRFCELASLDLERVGWSGCTRTRRFRPPKRFGSSAAIIHGILFMFGGYEISARFQPLEGDPVSKKTLNLFAYPFWWTPKSLISGFTLQDGISSPQLTGFVLGDFYGYHIARSEWSVLINRENRSPVLSCNLSAPTISRSIAKLARKTGLSKAAVRSSFNYVFQKERPHPHPRAFHTLVAYKERFLILFGGESFPEGRIPHDLGPSAQKDVKVTTWDPIYYNDVWIFDLNTGNWSFCKDSLCAERRSISMRDNSTNWNKTMEPFQEPLPNAMQYFHNYNNKDAATFLSRHGSENNAYACALNSNPCTLGIRLVRPPPRSAHTAVIYKDGMYVYGGQNSRSKIHFGDLWVFDVSSLGWTQLHPAGISPGPLFGHTAVVVGNGMFVYGGSGTDKVKSKLEAETRKSDLRAPHYLKLKLPLAENKKFSMHCLNFGNLTWSTIVFGGCSPENAKRFGRLQGCYWKGRLFLGGVAVKDMNTSFELTHVSLPSEWDSCFFETGRLALATARNHPLARRTEARKVDSEMYSKSLDWTHEKSSYVPHLERFGEIPRIMTVQAKKTLLRKDFISFGGHCDSESHEHMKREEKQFVNEVFKDVSNQSQRENSFHAGTKILKSSQNHELRGPIGIESEFATSESQAEPLFRKKSSGKAGSLMEIFPYSNRPKQAPFPETYSECQCEKLSSDIRMKDIPCEEGLALLKQNASSLSTISNSAIAANNVSSDNDSTTSTQRVVFPRPPVQETLVYAGLFQSREHNPSGHPSNSNLDNRESPLNYAKGLETFEKLYSEFAEHKEKDDFFKEILSELLSSNKRQE